jgi:hypothetical protein
MKHVVLLAFLWSLLLSACGMLPPAVPAVSSTPNAGKTATPVIQTPASSGGVVLLFGVGMHIEPLGTTHQGFSSNKGDYAQPAYFKRGIEDIQAVASIVAAHGGRMTIQAQSPFTDAALANKSAILKDLAAAGHEIGLHFHEDAHLGRNSSAIGMDRWCAVMKEEIDLIRQASGVSSVSYWSGGNLYLHLFDAAACAGLAVNSDWKSPQTQTTDLSLMGVNPWRPAGGTDGADFTRFAAHNPSGKIVFLPEGLFNREDFASMRRSEDAGGDELYFEYLKQSLMDSLAAAQAGKVNVFHFTVHPGEFRGNSSHPFLVIDQFLKEVVDPLAKQGKIKWATFSQMATTYTTWEQTHPGQGR